MEDLNVVETPKPPISPISHIPLISLIIILVLSLFLSVFLGYQSIQLRKEIERLKTSVAVVPSPTANWKTFTDTKYNFKYPNDWTNKDIPVDSFIVVSIGNQANTLTLSLAEKLPGLGFETEMIEGKIIVDGKELKKWTPKDLDYQTKSSNQIVWISLGENTGDFLTLYDASATTDSPSTYFDQILSTFKFIDEEPKKCLDTTNPCEPQGCSYNPNWCAGSRSCGGIAGVACPSGYTCKLEGNYPDASGACVKESSSRQP